MGDIDTSVVNGHVPSVLFIFTVMVGSVGPELCVDECYGCIG